ncbi:MAG TPA: ATP synthase F0 subunit B [Planctomycetaceae bacterium]|nr:ATP synthase F0 subunit B [Planctomycetaceae bacterium]
MSPTLTTFLFEAANFLVLAAVLGWLFFKPVRQALQNYRARLDTLSQQAQAQLAEAEQTRAQLQVERNALRDELAKVRTETLEAARQEAARIANEARDQAARLRRSAEQHVAHLDQSQAALLAQAVAVAAGKLVGDLLTQIASVDLNASLIHAACDQLRGLSLDGTPVTIESPQPIADEDRAKLAAVLGAAAANASYRVVPDLGSGVRITTSRGLVDATVAGLAEFAQRALASELERRASNGGLHGS